jgi:hypothetical protein
MTDYVLSKLPIEVKLNEEEVKKSVNFIRRLQEDKQKHGVTDRMFDRNNTSSGINQVGHLGEVAVGKVLGLPVDYKIRTGGDEGFDLQLNRATIQIKTTSTQTASLIFNAKHLFSADVAVLVQFVGADKKQSEKDPRFKIWGWCTRSHFMSNYYNHDYGYGMRLVLDSENLWSLNSLLEEYGA